MYKNGGYVIVSHDDANIYSKVGSAFANQKPILFYDDDNTCYFIDTIKKDGDGNYILTKGGRTFTITDVNSVMAEGNIQNHLYKYVVEFKDNSDDTFTIFITTNELLEDDLTFDDIWEYVCDGDFGQTNGYTEANEYVAYVCDKGSKQITYASTNGVMLDTTLNQVVSYELIKQLF